MRKSKLTKVTAIIIGVLIAIPLLVFGFLTLQGVFTRASDDSPQNVTVSKITATGATVSWTTDQETTGTLQHGTTPTQLVAYAPELGAKNTVHSVDLTLLQPATTIYFKIQIGDTTYDNAGQPWTFTTKSKPSTEATPSGQLEGTTTPEPTEDPLATESGDLSPTAPNTSPTKTGAIPTLRSSTATRTPTGGSSTGVCPTAAPNGSNCAALLAQLGKGCTSVDYVRCINRTVSPSVTPTPSNSPTPSNTATPSPTALPTLAPAISMNAVSLTDTSIRVSWTDLNSYETGYKVQRSINSTSSWQQVVVLPSSVASSNSYSYDDTGLTGGNLYYYRVVAYYGSTDSVPSSTVSTYSATPTPTP